MNRTTRTMRLDASLAPPTGATTASTTCRTTAVPFGTVHYVNPAGHNGDRRGLPGPTLAENRDAVADADACASRHGCGLVAGSAPDAPGTRPPRRHRTRPDGGHRRCRRASAPMPAATTLTPVADSSVRDRRIGPVDRSVFPGPENLSARVRRWPDRRDRRLRSPRRRVSVLEPAQLRLRPGTVDDDGVPTAAGGRRCRRREVPHRTLQAEVKGETGAPVLRLTAVGRDHVTFDGQPCRSAVWRARRAHVPRGVA